jgi:hypothetical protein
MSRAATTAAGADEGLGADEENAMKLTLNLISGRRTAV